jgi:ribonuclease Z
MERFGPSTLVEAAGQKFIFDAGRGAIQRLRQINVRWQDIDGVFFTHLHSDHLVGFPDLWLTGWLVGAGRNRPLAVWGPAGTKHMISHLEEAYSFDIRIRIADAQCKPDGVQINATDIEEGVVYEKEGVKVTAILVDHASVKPAFGYRIDSGGRSVVLSGDTRFCENLINHSLGADLLIHEVAALESMRRTGFPPERISSLVGPHGHHTTPEQAGEVFATVKPRLAVYFHIVHPEATADELIAPTRKSYSGPLEIGEDLMVIEVGEQVTVRRPDGASP